MYPIIFIAYIQYTTPSKRIDSTLNRTTGSHRSSTRARKHDRSGVVKQAPVVIGRNQKVGQKVWQQWLFFGVARSYAIVVDTGVRVDQQQSDSIVVLGAHRRAQVLTVSAPKHPIRKASLHHETARIAHSFVITSNTLSHLAAVDIQTGASRWHRLPRQKYHHPYTPIHMGRTFQTHQSLDQPVRSRITTMRLCLSDMDGEST